jgi:hydroxymethylpyrimidine/phosphomethylpyrimidine kinase / thiaminase
VRTLIRSNADVWKQYVQHDFVKQLGQGTLSRERFIHFFKCATTVPTGLLYSPLPSKAGLSLSQILRASKRVWRFPLRKPWPDSGVCADSLDSFHSLLVAKSSAYFEFAAAAEVVLAIVKERSMHVSFCAHWGVDLSELENTPESSACTAYGAYIMDVGMKGALGDLPPVN